jgi:phosphatidylserine/phosphatidylglycerophosphate/cardiolipin synthase-like enzyme
MLTAAGIPATYFTAHYLHGKCVVGDATAFVGSQNFTNGGLGNNRELGELLRSSAIVDELAKSFLADERSPSPR